MEKVEYKDVRDRMKAGDVIAFGGRAAFSKMVKIVTKSPVSHCATILQTREIEEDTGRYFNQIIEADTNDDYSGVGITRLSKKIKHYDGDVWWLPLNNNNYKQKFNRKKFYNFLFHQAERKAAYDMNQVFASALDGMDKTPWGSNGPTRNREDFEQFFCSELIAAGFEEAGILPSLNSSEITPADLVRFNLYEGVYLLKGDDSISTSRFNRMDPKGWNG